MGASFGTYDAEMEPLSWRYRLNIMNRTASGLLLTLLLSACGAPGAGEPRIDGPRGRGEGAWSQMAESPLSARYASQAVAIGEKLYVIGGTAADPCPPNASCIEPPEPFFTDGAIYDPETEMWAAMADAPIPIGYGSSSVVDGKLYVLVKGYGSTHPSTRAAFLSYDPEGDQWEELSLPRDHDERILTSKGPRVVAFQSSQENGVREDLVYDLETDTWSELPPDPLRESFDRWMVWTDNGLVLTGIENVPQPGSDGPALYRAAVLAEGKWKAFGESQIFGYNPEWSWTAGRVLNPSNERADGGETNNWGKTYNAGGTFDPETGEWALLSDPPQGRGEFEGVSAAGGRYAIAYSGWVYDAIDERWLHLTRQDDGPEVDMSAAWVGDELYVFGGVDWQDSEGVILDAGWVWTPADD